MNNDSILIVLLAYIVITSLLAWISSKGMGKGMSEYFLANRRMSGLLAALSYSATTYSAFMMVGLAGLTYKGGIGALGFELIYLSGLVLTAFFGPRFWLAGKRYNYITPAEMLGDRYESKTLAVVVSIACCIFLIPYSAVQLMGIGYLLTGLSGGSFPFMAGVLITALVAIIWAWWAGMRSVAWTDSLQAIIMMLSALTIVFFVIYRGFGGFSAFATQLSTQASEWLSVPGPGFFSFRVFLGLSLPWFFFSISNPQVSQRLYIPRNLANMRIMIMGFLVFGFIYTIISIIWGFSAKLLVPGLTNPDLATPSLLALDIIPPILALIMMVGITAAAISTIDSILLTLSSMVSRDIYRNIRPEVDENQQVLAGKLVMPVIAVLAIVFASKKINLISVLAVASSAGLLVIVPAIVGTFFWKKGTAAGAITSIVGAGVITFAFQFRGITPLGLGAGVWSLITATVLFVLVSLFTPAPKKADKFINYINENLKQRNAI